MNLKQKAREPRGEPFSTLYFDIETSNMLVKTHYIGRKVSIHPEYIKKHKKIICISYLWNHEDESQVKHLKWDSSQDDAKLLLRFNKIAARAGKLCGHNAKNFDAKTIRWMMANRGLEEVWCNTPIVDTLAICRRSFRMESYRLDAIGEHLGLGRKIKTSFDLWDRTEEGDRQALRDMCLYCDQDVILVRRVHNYLDRYALTTKAEDAIGLAEDEYYGRGCDHCGSSSIIKYGTTYRAQFDKCFQRYKCTECKREVLPGLDQAKEELLLQDLLRDAYAERDD